MSAPFRALGSLNKGYANKKSSSRVTYGVNTYDAANNYVNLTKLTGHLIIVAASASTENNTRPSISYTTSGGSLQEIGHYEYTAPKVNGGENYSNCNVLIARVDNWSGTVNFSGGMYHHNGQWQIFIIN